MWAGFIAASLMTLISAYLFVYLRFGRDNFPYLLKDIDSEIVVMDDILTADKAASLSESVEKLLSSHDYPKKTANHAALFVEEICLTILEKNKRSKKRFYLRFPCSLRTIPSLS